MEGGRTGVRGNGPLPKWPLEPIRCLLLFVGVNMRRREFLVALGGTAIACPLTVHAQQAKLPTIGFFGTGSSASGGGPWTAAFVQRLRELGWTDGGTATIVYRWAEGRMESYSETAAEFVRLKVDVIVSFGEAMPAMNQ